MLGPIMLSIKEKEQRLVGLESG